MLKELFQSIWTEATQAITKQRDAQEAKAVVFDGLPYLQLGSTLREHRMPGNSGLSIHTLAGFVEAVTKNVEKHPQKDQLYAIVEGPACVGLWTPPLGPWRQDEEVLSANADLPTPFTFGIFKPVEKFGIELQTLFADSPDRTALLKTLAGVASGPTRTAMDDGVSQHVTVKAGVHLVGEVQVKNPVMLRPYRTFFDIEQPLSAFIFRVQGGGDAQEPKVALFEADGGAWRHLARQNILAYLTGKLGSTVILH